VVAVRDDSGLGRGFWRLHVGKMFGKHKLAPKVSPGNLAGFFGGLLTAAVISWAYGWWAHLNVTPMVLLVFYCRGPGSVLGDLTESMFKREAGIKDSGNLIPGHGGILDRIDSLTAAVPVFACLLFGQDDLTEGFMLSVLWNLAALLLRWAC
jgi:CDP-diglyceride synthetase